MRLQQGSFGLRKDIGRRALGLTMAAAIAVGAPLQGAQAQVISFIRDTEIESLLSDYARPIFRAAGLGSNRITMRIVKHESFNAFVLDGRNVFVHTGAIQQSETPNQLIGVIAHETGHIAGGHMAQLRERIARDQTKSLLVKLLGIGLIVAGGATGANTTGAGIGAIAGGDEIIMRSLLGERRAQESSADQAGLRFLTSTKQSGRGMLETFERFAQQEYVSASGQNQDAFARSHPVAATRLAQLRDAVGKSPYVNQQDAPALQMRHDLVRAKIAGYLERPQTVFNRYPEKNQSLAARYARAIARFFLSGVDKALPQVDRLIKEQPGNPYFHELRADFLMRSGRTREAIPSLRQALKLMKGDAPLISVRLAQALVGTDDASGVDESIALARKSIIGDPNPQAYRILASNYYKKGRTPQADLAIAEAHFLEGNIKQAKIFAQRASRGLKGGSPEGLRAGDIVNYKGPSSPL
ncbi:MAG: M48 family metalloprotease [Hyphomicrobiaceae bacterium]